MVMKKHKTKVFPRVEVSWTDAATTSDIEIDKALAEDISKRFVSRTTLGWLIKKDKTGTVIASDIQEAGLCDVWAIPGSFNPKVKYI